MAVSQRPIQGFVSAVAAGVAAYVAIGALAYVLFYNHFPSDGEKAWFMLVYSLHLLSTLSVSYLLARLLRAPPLLWIVAAVAVIALSALPTLTALSIANGCHGVDFPIAGLCPN